ncbi:MAG: C40 family peptidase [Cohaesibacteraceae bacterium]|nr:C40 family peptidase [Cohaesibacteraceae bacterium]
MSDRPLDKRLNFFGPNLADVRLKGQVEASRFVEGRLMQIAVPLAGLHNAPRPDAGLDTQVLMGERVRVFEDLDEGYCLVQLEACGYIGFVPSHALGQIAEITHRVSALRSFVYPGSDLRLPPEHFLSLGCAISLGAEKITRDTPYRQMIDRSGWIFAGHAEPVNQTNVDDYVTVAEMFLETPYLWGGKSSLGIDCSGLVQLAAKISGQGVLRDTDMQAESAGAFLSKGAELPKLQRGDLIFWRGHVGIMTDAKTLLHASGHHMAVVKEPLKGAIERIAKNEFGAVTGTRRLALCA